MNTITIETTNKDSGTPVQITYTERDILNFIEKIEELSNVYERLSKSQEEVRKIRYQVRDFFSEGEWSDSETTVNKGDVNMLLESIGSNKLTTVYSATFTVTGTFQIEVEDEDDVESIFVDNLNVDCYGGNAEIDVDQIEVLDIEVYE